MSPSTLCQIYVPASSGVLPARSYYNVGVNGRFKAKLLGITFADTTDAKDNRLIRFYSDSFRSVCGTYPQTIVIANRHESNMGNPQGEFPMYWDVVGGRIDLEILSSTAYANTANNTFNFAILTFKLEPVDDS